MQEKSKYEVFLCECSAHIPFQFGRHSWFVIREGENFFRYEVLWERDISKNSHIYVNSFLPFQGINRIPFYQNKFFSRAVILGSLAGNDAISIIQTIQESAESYPYKKNYRLLWPNSNTYTQWILDQSKDFPHKLSKNAIGKGYKKS